MIVSLLGVPWDGSSSFQRGAASAPAAIRAALHSPSSNSCNERGDDLAAKDVLHDAGDLLLPADAALARQGIERGVRDILAARRLPLILGGDHSITYPALRAFNGQIAAPTVVHFDAHADLYDHFPWQAAKASEPAPGVDRFSHACPFARIMEEQLACRLI